VTSHSDPSDDVQWILVSKGEEEQAKKLEAASMKVSLQNYEEGLYWSCLRCNKSDLSKGEIMKHVRNRLSFVVQFSPISPYLFFQPSNAESH
jgi:hypothetical protein